MESGSGGKSYGALQFISLYQKPASQLRVAGDGRHLRPILMFTKILMRRGLGNFFFKQFVSLRDGRNRQS